MVGSSSSRPSLSHLLTFQVEREGRGGLLGSAADLGGEGGRKREGLARDLDGKRQSFLQEHGQDIDELRQLRERGETIRQRLRAAREKVISDNLPAIQEMRRTTQEARNVANELRFYYRQRWRSEEQKAPPGEE